MTIEDINDSEEYSKSRYYKHLEMKAMQALPYEVKVAKAKQRIKEFIDACYQMGYNTHVSVGGLDSITLYCLIRSMGYDIPAISVSCLEDKSIIQIHHRLGVIMLKPTKTKHEILQEYGFPVISKKIATKIEMFQNPTEKNASSRHSYITGDVGEKGHYAKNSVAKLGKKWLRLFGGYENEREGTNYGIPNFKVSSKCCKLMKEKPCNEWAKRHNSKPFIGIMAVEGGA